MIKKLNNKYQEYIIYLLKIKMEIIKTFNFAAEKHKFQRRKDSYGIPYINHPIRVCHRLFHQAGITDLEVLQAAILHDTLEDTKTTPEEIEKEFGSEVLKIVKECTDDKSLPANERKKLQILHAETISYKAKLVKLADKIDNLYDLKSNHPTSWTLERIQGYFYWSYLVIEKLRGTNSKLENELDIFFSGVFTYAGKEYPILVHQDERNQLIEKYYELMSK